MGDAGKKKKQKIQFGVMVSTRKKINVGGGRGEIREGVGGILERVILSEEVALGETE